MQIHGHRNPYNIVQAVWKGLSGNTSFREQALTRGKNLYTMLEPRLVRPRFPTNKDMVHQREMVSDIISKANSAWEERQAAKAQTERALDEMFPKFVVEPEHYPSVPPPIARQ